MLSINMLADLKILDLKISVNALCIIFVCLGILLILLFFISTFSLIRTKKSLQEKKEIGDIKKQTTLEENISFFEKEMAAIKQKFS